MLEGKALPIHYTALTHASQVISSINTTVNVTRGLTRLKAVFISLFNDGMLDAATPGLPINESCTYFHPMGYAAYDGEKEVECQFQVGSKLYPEYPIRSLSEAFYQLRKTLGIHVGNESMNMEARYYRSHMFVLGFDLEKVLGSSFSCQNTKSGDLLTVKTKNAGSGAGLLTSGTSKQFYALSFDALGNIKLSGIDVLE